MRSYVQQASREQLTAVIGPGAAAIAEIVPEIRGQLPDLETPPALEPEAARFHLFTSITTFLKNAAQNQPFMLVLDDLHWADRSSLLLLEFLARELGEARILLVGCYRDTDLSRQHILTETLAQLSREPVFRRQVLRGLGQDDLEEFISLTTGVQLPQNLTDTLYAHTEGNPFFMTEIIRLLSESGEFTAGHIGTLEGTKIPDGVREVVGQRLNRLSERCNEVLTTASIIGREFDFRLLNILNGEISEEGLLQAVEEAVSFHLIEEVPGRMDRYQFVHALVQQTLTEEVTTSRSVRLHARIAEALEQLYAADVEAHATELAYHYSEAEAVLGNERLGHFSRIAGERALAAYAFDEALAFLSRALAAREGETGPQPAERATDEDTAAILLALGYAQAALDQLNDALSSFHRAFDLYTSLGNVSKVVEIAEYGHDGGLIAGMSDLIPRALDMVDPDSHDAGKILANYGYALGVTGDGLDSGLAALERALVISKHENDKILEARTLADMANIYGFHLHWEECLNAGSRAIELSVDLDDFQSEMRARMWVATASVAKGDSEQASYLAENMLELAEKRRDRTWIDRTLQRVLTVAVARGDWNSAREVCRRYPSGVLATSVTMFIDQMVGDAGFGDLTINLGRQDSYSGSTTDWIGRSSLAHMVAVAARVTGDSAVLALAESNAVNLLNSDHQLPPYWERAANLSLAIVAVEQGDKDTAERLYRSLLWAHQYYAWPVCSDRILGLLSQTMGSSGQAQTHFEDALDFCRNAGYRPELAWTCFDYADMLLSRNESGDVTNAMSLLDESMAISTELGMRPLMERITERLDRIQAPPSPAPSYPAGLSQREVEVLRLISAGKTDREIAEELFISFRTVGNHVRNILNKTNTANRTEAATFANQQGLIHSS
jgi:DNA-binding CsgD family transcriptional regulator/tetratricopeptide (TPR) repeat protein